MTTRRPGCVRQAQHFGAFWRCASYQAVWRLGAPVLEATGSGRRQPTSRSSPDQPRPGASCYNELH